MKNNWIESIAGRSLFRVPCPFNLAKRYSADPLFFSYESYSSSPMKIIVSPVFLHSSQRIYSFLFLFLCPHFSEMMRNTDFTGHSSLEKVLMQASSRASQTETRASALPVAKYLNRHVPVRTFPSRAITAPGAVIQFRVVFLLTLSNKRYVSSVPIWNQKIIS
jgi:hypothetical protein